jgi:putative FmdB family regulatory protein
MPTYEYACRECGDHLEVVQSFKDEPLTECPSCKGALRKVFSPIGIAFKGSGFYKTDSRSSSGHGKGDSKTSNADAAASGNGATSSGAKADSVSGSGSGASSSAGSGSASSSAGAA